MGASTFDPTPGKRVFGMCFETRRPTRIADKVLAFLLACGTFSLAIFVPFAVGRAAVDAGCPLIAAVAIGLVMVFVAVKFSWRLVLSKLRFCIVFHPECLQIGRGLAKCLIPYDDVETISLPLRNERGSWIKVGCRKYRARVILDPEQIRGCLSWLRQYSANAIVVDENGREHLLRNPHDADRTLDAMERYFRRKAGVLVWAGCFCGCLFVGQIWTFIQWWQGRLQIDPVHLEMMRFVSFGFVLLAIGALARRGTPGPRRRGLPRTYTRTAMSKPSREANHDLRHVLPIFGSALVAVPIILHLIMRRKPKMLEFPALRFIQKRHDANQRRLKLRHLLLLLLRMAAIALLALALAAAERPLGRQHAGKPGAPVAAALVFDAAPRMAYRHENKTRLEVAREWGLSLLPEFPPESQLAVFDTRFGGGGFAADRGVAKQRISRLETVTNSQPLARTVKDAVDLLVEKSDLPRKEIYVFTDFALAAWPGETAATLQDCLAKAPGVTIYLIDVGIKDPVDFSLGEVRLSHQVLANLGSLDIDSEVSCIGRGAIGPSSCKWTTPSGSRRPSPLPAGGSRQVDFHLEGLRTGTHRGLVRIIGQDGLAADDTRYFTVAVKPPWRILIAAAKPAAERRWPSPMALAPAISVKQKPGPLRLPDHPHR